MDINIGEFPTQQPFTGLKVLRKVIAQRTYDNTGVAKVSVCQDRQGVLYYRACIPPNTNTYFVRYVVDDWCIVYVTALYYVHVVPPAAAGLCVTPAQLVTAWTDRLADNQWGTAVFTSGMGSIDTMWWFGTGAALIPGASDWGPLSSISQIYPCLSYETRTTLPAGNHRLDGCHLCVGLYFGFTTTGAADVAGRRRFVRGPFPHLMQHTREDYRTMANNMLHLIGNVWEILDRHFWSDIPVCPTATHCFAIYLCAGARLVVWDDLNCDPQRHNRTLVQQGGLVMGEYELEWAPPNPLIYPLGAFRPLTTAQALQHRFLTTDDENLRQRLQRIHDPVVFLGATESKFETHCWELTLRESGGCRQAILSAPERGVVMAIESWANGMAEVVARHQYEQLVSAVVVHHRGFVQDCCHPFTVPADQNMLGKILGVPPHCDRLLGIDYTVGGIYQSGQPFGAPQPPVQPVVPVVCTQIDANVNDHSLKPPVLPLRPMFAIKVNANTEVSEFPPTDLDPEHHWRHIGDHWYRWVDAVGVDRYQKYEWSVSYQKKTEWEMARVGYYKSQNISGAIARVGVDGWAYRNEQNAKRIGTFWYPLYTCVPGLYDENGQQLGP